MLIQILLIVLIAVLAVFLTQAPVGSKHQAARRMLMLGFLAACVVGVLWPGILTDLAHFVGVGRGTDLLLYAIVVAFAGYVVVNGRRNDHMMSKITLLTRELALMEAKLDEERSMMKAAGVTRETRKTPEVRETQPPATPNSHAE